MGPGAWAHPQLCRSAALPWGVGSTRVRAAPRRASLQHSHLPARTQGGSPLAPCQFWPGQGRAGLVRRTRGCAAPATLQRPCQSVARSVRRCVRQAGCQGARICPEHWRPCAGRPETKLDAISGGRQEVLPDGFVEKHLGMTQAGPRSRAPHHDRGEAATVMQCRPGLSRSARLDGSACGGEMGEGPAGSVSAHRQFSMSYIGLRRPRGASTPAAPLLALAGAAPLNGGGRVWHLPRLQCFPALPLPCLQTVCLGSEALQGQPQI